jgi:hypothetical protein
VVEDQCRVDTACVRKLEGVEIRFERMTQQDRRRRYQCAKMRLHVDKRRCYGVERSGCYSRKAWIGDQCEKTDRSLANLPGEIVGDWAWWFDKLIVNNLSRIKIDNANVR